MNGLKQWASRQVIIGAALCLMVGGCAPKELSGTYEFTSSSHSSVIVIDPGRRFRQIVTLHNGEVITIDGEWRMDGRAATFSPFLYSGDSAALSILDRPKKMHEATGGLRGDVIVFSEDNDYWFSKK